MPKKSQKKAAAAAAAAPAAPSTPNPDASPPRPANDDASTPTTAPYVPSSASPPADLNDASPPSPPAPAAAAAAQDQAQNNDDDSNTDDDNVDAPVVSHHIKRTGTVMEHQREKNPNDGDDDDDAEQLPDSSDDEEEEEEEDPESRDAFKKAIAAANKKNGDDSDEDDPFLKGADGNLIRRPLGTKKEIRELTSLSKKTGDFSFADDLEPDEEGYKPVTWGQLRHNVGFERQAHKFKLHGVVSMRDQANWDKIKRIGVRDPDGFEASLYFYDNDPQHFSFDDLTVGQKIAVKSPRYHRFMDGSEGMRVESCNSIAEVKYEKFKDEDRLDFGKMHKAAGNKKFAERRYEDAIDKYDEALKSLVGTFHDTPEIEQEAKTLAADCHLNIAACFGAEKKWTLVERPCRKALTINASNLQNTKAYFRIGQAQHKLGNLVNATQSLERALELTPGEPRVLQELEEVRKSRFELTEAQRDLFRTKAESRRDKEDAQQKQKQQKQPQQQSQRSVSPGAAGAAAADSRSTSPPLSPGAAVNAEMEAAALAALSRRVFFEDDKNNKQHQQARRRIRFGYQRSVLAALSGTRPLEQELDRIENIRDVGGLPAAGGAVKKHLLYRSATLVNMSKGDLSFLTERLGIKTVIDLREVYEVASAVARRKQWVDEENLKRARIRLEMKKTEIEVRERRERGESITSSSDDDDVDALDAKISSSNNNSSGKGGNSTEKEILQQRTRVFRRRMRALRNKKKFSAKGDAMERVHGNSNNESDQDEDEEDPERQNDDDQLVPLEDFDGFLQRTDDELRKLEYVDYEAHFKRVSIKCNEGRVTSYESAEYDEFLNSSQKKLEIFQLSHQKGNSNSNSNGDDDQEEDEEEDEEARLAQRLIVPTRQEWLHSEPVSLHLDFSSRTVFALAPYWVWLVAMLLGILFQVQWAAWVVVKMTASRVGALKYYRQMLANQGQEIREVFELLADDRNFPVLVCCELGKDRTGVLIAVILMACGVPKQAVVQDYAKTKSTANLRAKCAKLGLVEPEWTQALAVTMEKLVDSVEEEGGIEQYLRGIGVSEETLAAVRENLCEVKN